MDRYTLNLPPAALHPVSMPSVVFENQILLMGQVLDEIGRK